MEDRQGLAALVRSAREGEAVAWEALYRRAYPRLLAYARRRLPTDDAARDAVSETMARAVRGIASFRDDGNGFDAWIAGILRHVVLDAHRASARRAVPDELTDRPSVDPGPEELVMSSSDAAGMRSAFARLSDFDRQLLELRVVLGLGSEEVAAVLGKRPGAIRMAQSRALERLRNLLAEDEKDAGVHRGI